MGVLRGIGGVGLRRGGVDSLLLGEEDGVFDLDFVELTGDSFRLLSELPWLLLCFLGFSSFLVLMNLKNMGGAKFFFTKKN